MPRGRVLPIEANPRSGWKDGLHGQPHPVVSKEMHQDIVVLKSVLRDKQGYVRRYLNEYNEDIAALFDEEEAEEERESAAQLAAATASASASASACAVESDADSAVPQSSDLIAQDDDEVVQRDGDGEADAGEKAIDGGAECDDEEDEEYDDLFVAEGSVTAAEANDQRDMLAWENSLNDSLSAVDLLEYGEELKEEERMQIFEREHAKILDRMIRKRLRVIHEANLREQDVGGVLIDAREVLDSIGLQNSRQVHNLQLRSVYAGYSAGGEPLYTLSAPKERNRMGTSCVDYIFYSSATISLRAHLSIPCLSQLREGTSPQQPCCVAQIDHSRPMHIARRAFDAPLKKLFQSLNIATDGDLLSSTDDPNSVQAVPRSKIEDAKRFLRRSLVTSHTAGNDGTQKGTLWGGKWAPLPTENHQRANFFLPNDVFASSHIALAAEFGLNEDLLAVRWS